MIEEQLQPNSASGSGALEHDETYLYRRDTSLTSFNIINYLFRSSSTTDNRPLTKEELNTIIKQKLCCFF